MSASNLDGINQFRSSSPLVLRTLAVVSYFLWAASGASFVWFLLARVLLGVSRANVGVLSAMMSDISDRETRTRGMATVGAAYSVAFLVGPPASAWLFGRLLFTPGESGGGGVSVLGPHIGLAAAALAFLDYIFLCSFPETAAGAGMKDEGTPKSAKPKRTFWGSLKLMNPFELFRFQSIVESDVRLKLQKMAQVFFLHMVLYSGLECSLLFLAQLRFGYTGRDQGRIFLITGLTMLTVQSGFVKRFKGGREAKTSIAAMYFQAIAYLIVGFAPNELVFYAGLVFYSIASACFVPAFSGLTSLSVGPQYQGQIMGIFRSLGGLARSVGPSLIGALLWLVGPYVAFTIGSLATLGVSVFFQRIPTSESVGINAEKKQ